VHLPGHRYFDSNGLGSFQWARCSLVLTHGMRLINVTGGPDSYLSYG
jgi:hypothetical protein